MVRKAINRSERRAYFFLVLPAILVYAAVMAFPTVFSIGISLSNYSGGRLFGGDTVIKYVGLRHFQRVFTDPYFWLSLKNNIYVMLVSIFGQIPLGFILAYILHRKLVGMRGFFQTIIYLPAVISPIVVGILWQTILLSPYGAFTEMVRYFIPGWENTSLVLGKGVMVPILFSILWMYTGTYLIIFLANLQKIDPQLIEAARIDGANERQIMGRVILPALSGVIVTSAILAISGSLQSFSLVYAMTQGNPAKRTSLLAIYMYDTAFKQAPNYPKANAISIIIVFFSFALIVLTKAIEKRFGGRE